MSPVLAFHRKSRTDHAPPLVLVEMFEDQLIPQPSFQIDFARAVLDNCRCLLKRARTIGWPIAFAIDAQRLHQTKWSRTGWIDGFRPSRADMVFETSKYSCYSSSEFADAVTRSGNSFLLAGFSGGRTCLTTLIEAANHNHHGGIVEDACYFHALHGLDAHDSVRALLAVVKSYATTITTSEWLAIVGASRPILESTYDTE